MLIKYVQVLLLLVFASTAISRVTSNSKFEEGLRKLIEKCQIGDVQSLPVAFPSLNPLKIPPITLNHDGYAMSLSEVKVKGLENLSVEKLSAFPQDLKISMEIIVPTLAIRAERYHLQGKVFLFITIDDKGVFKSHVNNVRVKANMQFGAKGNNTMLTDLDVDYSVEDIQIHLSGSLGIVNSKANTMISDLIRSGEMKERLENIIKIRASEYLRGHTPQEFVEIISAM